MAILISSETTGTGTGNASNQVTITKPSTVYDRDYLVVIMGAADDLPNVTGDTGWTRADINASSTGNDRQIAIFYKYVAVASSEPSTYTFGLGNGDAGAWWIGISISAMKTMAVGGSREQRLPARHGFQVEG